MRVAICQPLVPAYRVNLFERLGTLPNIELSVFAGRTIGSLPGVEQGKHFRLIRSPVRRGPLDLSVQAKQVSALLGRFDLVIVPWDIHYLTLLPCIPLARALNVPLVLWGHGYSRHGRYLADAVRNAYGKLAHGVLLYNRRVADHLVKQHHFACNRVFVANNALDQTPIQAARQFWTVRPAELRAFQAEQGIDPLRTLIFVSRLEPENEIELLLRAASIMLKTLPSIRVVIVGDGSDRVRLERLSTSLGISARVTFTGAVYDEIELARWMMSAALFCYPTRIGLSILHAFGYGLPVVTTDSEHSQNPELDALVDHVNGLKYRDGDVEHFAASCARIVLDSALRARLSLGALETIAQEYSMDTMVRGFVDMFDRIAVHPRRSVRSTNSKT